MKRISTMVSLAIALFFLGASSSNALPTTPSYQEKETSVTATSNKLVLIWSSDDPMVAKRVALMYPHAAKKNNWFDEVILVIWGPSAKLISENVELQNKLEQMKRDGVVIKACLACADEYGVTDKLKKLGYDVIFMGVPLTEYLNKGYKVLTF